jgi:hypothetical protein
MDKKLNILGVEYTVQIVDVVSKDDPRRGEINYLTNVIKIDKEMPLSQKNHTLMHEILHALFDLLGLEDLRDDESKIQSIATGIHQLFSSQQVFFTEEEQADMRGEQDD